MRSQGVFDQGTEFTAAPGEANDVTVTHEGAGPDQRVVTIHDAGAIPDAGMGCASSDPHTARCLTGGVVAWFVLGDGDDPLQTLQPYSIFDIVANGGPGNDVLDIRNGSTQSQSYEEILDGGGGHDRLYGGRSVTTSLTETATARKATRHPAPMSWTAALARVA